MLPVANPEEFWYAGTTRKGNARIPVVIGAELNPGGEFEFEIRSQWGGLNGRMTKAPFGMPESELRELLARRPTLIPYSVGVVLEEEYRTPARLEVLIATGHHTEVLRNLINTLSTEHPEAFAKLQAVLARHFAAGIDECTFQPASQQYINVRYRAGEVAHDIFSVGGGFLQVLQLLTYVHLHNPGILLLDEPDAHLHTAMQRAIIDILREVAQRESIQVILATHSKEIINYVDPQTILPITKDLAKAEPLSARASKLEVLQQLGPLDNVDLASLIASKRCFVIEGATDRPLYTRFAEKLESAVFQGNNQLVVISANGVDNPEKLVNLKLFEELIGTQVKMLMARDRDGLPEDSVTEIEEGAAQSGCNLIVLGRCDIEAYLVVPNAIMRVLNQSLTARTGSAAVTSAQISAIIEEALSELKDDTLDDIAAEINQHSIVYHRKHLDVKTCNQRARQHLEQKWTTLDSRLSVVSGKKLLRKIRTRIQSDYTVAFSDVRLADELQADEVHPDIRTLIGALEKL